ncbi:MAG: right-handed parallel beta-helix repeat-containing protein [Clostridia bacterium]|nr:right-handed parallel beta-helix repeat-containing protein [Clostridia bacterium]
MIDYRSSATIYVSATEGNDLYGGFAPHPVKTPLGCFEGPVRTLARAMKLLAGLRVPGRGCPITVRIEGDHYLSAPLSFSLSPALLAAGYRMCDITLESYGKGRARLVGGRRIEGLAPDVFRGTPCLSVHLPDVENGSWHFTDLYVNGRRATPARYPREGTLHALAVERESGPSAWTSLHDGSRWFIADKRDLEGIDGIENATVSFYHYWVDEHSPVESYDPETGRITMAYRSRYKNSVQYGQNAASELCYYLENLPAGFGRPGDFYLDVPHGMLYYIPEDPTADPRGLEVLAPTLTQLLTVTGTPDAPATGIRLRHLDFICSRGDYASNAKDPSDAPVPVPAPEGYAADPQSAADAYGAVRFAYAGGCTVEDCRFTALGLHAVEILDGCEGIRIEGSSFSELGGGGVKIFGHTNGNEDVNKTSHCTIIRNSISHIGLRYAAATGILICHASQNEVSENEISYTVYSGISVGWVWGYTESRTFGNRIRRNHIHHIGIGLLSDMAGIYLLGIQSGTVVEENYVHDVQSAHYGGYGIYTDEGSSYVTVERNLVTSCRSTCFFQHYGAYNTVRDNTFAFGGEAIVSIGTRKEDAHLGVILEGNTMIADGTVPIYHTTAPALLCSVLRASRNRFWHIDGHAPVLHTAATEGGPHPVTLDEWQGIYGMDEGSTCEPPDEWDPRIPH